MDQEKIDLGSYARDVYSQSGEDGVLEELFRRLNIGKGYFVEFGAWDGQHLSNSYNLLKAGWAGLLIEADSKKFEVLRANVREPAITLRNAFVKVDGPTSLNILLKEVGAPKEIDLLSIDIDSDDLAILMSVTDYRAKCVVIEYNPTIPFDTPYINKPGRQIGNSAFSIMEYAKRANYELVALTRTNLILVDLALIDQADLAVQTLDVKNCPTYRRYFFGYDGTLICATIEHDEEDSELITVPWHGYKLLQPIPRFLRIFDGGKSVLLAQRAVNLWSLIMARPAIIGKVLASWSKREQR